MKISFLVVVVASIFIAGCGDKGSAGAGPNTPANANAPTTPLAQYYYIQKGLCYDDGDRRVETANCQGLSGYYEVNGYCYNPTHQRVENEYCQSNPSRVRPHCQGNEPYFMKRGKPYRMNCGKRGCRGYNVYDRDGRGYYCRS